MGHPKNTFSNGHAPKIRRDSDDYDAQKRQIQRIKGQEDSENSVRSHNGVRKCPFEGG